MQPNEVEAGPVAERDDDSVYYLDEELLVACEHHSLVAELLGAAATTIDTDAALELARLRLDREETEGWLSTQSASGAAGEALVDRVLGTLRASCRKQYNWAPVMGKNRSAGVFGNPKIMPGRPKKGVIGSGEGTPRSAGAVGEFRAGGDGSGARIGVLDTKMFPNRWLDGAYLSRPDSMWQQLPHLADGAPLPTDPVELAWAGHAAFVVGVILQQAPSASVLHAGVLDEDGWADTWRTAQAIVQLGRSGVDILNLSLSCFTEDNDPPLALATAIDRLPPDVVVVAAAGNSGAQRAAWPAALDDVISVGTGDGSADEVSRVEFSNDGPWVDFLASGVDVTSTYLDDTVAVPAAMTAEFGAGAFSGWASWSGTSFSAALVTGAIAARMTPGTSARQALAALTREARQGGVPGISVRS